MWQVMQHVKGYKGTSAPTVCEATLPNELNTFYICFILLNKDSAVKSTPPSEDRALSATTVDVRKVLLKVNINMAAGPNNIPGHVLKTCANQLFHSLRRLFPPASRQPLSALYLKSLQCKLLATTTVWLLS